MCVGQRGKELRKEKRVFEAKNRCNIHKLRWYHK